MKNKNLVPQIVITTVVSMALASTPVMAGYGSSPSNSTPCNNEAPAAPTFSFVRRSGASEIEIGWNKTNRANKWTIAYGKEPGKYIYGVADFGDENTSSAKIGMLPTGVYYVVIKASNGCMPGQFSAERKMTVFASGRVLGAKTVVPYTGNVLGTKDAAATPAPSVTTLESATPAPSSAPATEVRLNWLQRFIKFIFG